MREMSCLRAIIVASVCGAAAAPAVGSVLYGSVNESGGGGNEAIYTIDQISGQADFLGFSGFGAPLDLTSDWRAGSFRIWAPDTDSNQLLQIDPSNGSAVAVGSFETPSSMESLAFDTVTGRLFGTTRNDVLYEINPQTGHADLIGSVRGFGSLWALGFGLDGSLYAVSNGLDALITIDVNTGMATFVATVDLDVITAMAARPEDGVMFITDTGSDAIYTLDLETGQSTLVGPYGANLDFLVGLAFSVPDGDCPWDLDSDDIVGTGDLILLLGSWGDPYGTADLIELLGNWGPCPR